MPTCNWPDCNDEGEFKAPCDPRDLSKYQYFCKAHIKEFNKRWNGLEGFNENEIFSMQHGAATWHRPTWKMGVNDKNYTSLFETAEDLYSFFKKRQSEQQPQSDSQQLPKDVREACYIFKLDAPLTGKPLKSRYLELVKENHPDKNPDSTQAEDNIKKINVA
ncbi:MAG: J domain-containing protein, partial [Alphaproteobacteria bacterium]|nr:J domain-containing protein [Alphaproteobacteria bacterium]